MTNIEKNRAIVVTLLRVGNKMNEELNFFIKQFGISLPQFNVLRILRGQKGKAANLSTINEHMIHKMSNTTRLIDKLIEKEYVQRTICANNRRKIELFITPNGLQLLVDIDKKLDRKEAQLLEEIDPNEKDLLTSLLSKLIQQP
ncbi:MAG: MarR family transcriptional regulator [Flavobacteriaceae bacterium]|nr:MarR family transcriptional regulator [Flavobacteriaceae bacterium]